jgi:hypothetical protein
MPQVFVGRSRQQMGVTVEELISKLRSIQSTSRRRQHPRSLDRARVITGQTLVRRPRQVIVRSRSRRRGAAQGAGSGDRAPEAPRRAATVSLDEELDEVPNLAAMACHFPRRRRGPWMSPRSGCRGTGAYR